MAYKLTLPSGLVVEVDSSTELEEAVRVLLPQPIPPRPVQESVLPDSPQVDPMILRRFLRGMPSKQRKILDCLNAASESATDEQLWAALGITDNTNLGGTMGALSKRAIKIGMTIDDAFLKTSWQNENGRHYSYTITEGMRAAMSI